jgi:hypothetical protein
MKNEHGLECPVSWEEIDPDFNWVALDWNGDICAYAERPLLSRAWHAATFRCKRLKTTEPLKDYSLCLWKRPKTQSE